MPRWWHFLHLGLGSILLAIAILSFLVFDGHSPWNYLVLVGFAAAGVVYLLAGAGFRVEFGTRRLNGQRFAGVGTIVLGIAAIAIWVPDLTQGTVTPVPVFGLFVGLLTIGFGIGTLYRPAVFGTAARDEAVSSRT